MFIDIVFQSLAAIVALYILGGLTVTLVGGFQTQFSRARASRFRSAPDFSRSGVVAPIVEAPVPEPADALVPPRTRRRNTIAPVVNPILITPYRQGRTRAVKPRERSKPKKTLSSVIETEYTRARYTREELKGRTVVQLRRLARGIPGAASMRKDKLIDALVA